jgi:hypothetical protein
MTQDEMLRQIDQVEGWLHRTTQSMRLIVKPDEQRTDAAICRSTLDAAEMRAYELFSHLRDAAGQPPAIDPRLWPLITALGGLVESMDASVCDLPSEQSRMAIAALHHARHAMASTIVHLQRSITQVNDVTKGGKLHVTQNC